jgi:hypothetical protein
MMKAFYKMEDTSSIQKIRKIRKFLRSKLRAIDVRVHTPDDPNCIAFVVSDFASENSFN